VGQRITLENLEILFVEDDELVAESVVEFLRGCGATVYYAQNAVQAFEALRRHTGIRLMVTDIRMPIIDGKQLVKEAMQFWPKLHVIFTTGFADLSGIPQSTPVLDKPYAFEELERTILQFCPPAWLVQKQAGPVAGKAHEAQFDQAWEAVASSLDGSVSQTTPKLLEGQVPSPAPIEE